MLAPEELLGILTVDCFFSSSHSPLLTRSDKIHAGICAKLGITTEQLALAQVLEASTWKGGREIAASKRSNGGRECRQRAKRRNQYLPVSLLTAAPVEIISDGTVF
jgi:hypothetical protein